MNCLMGVTYMWMSTSAEPRPAAPVKYAPLSHPGNGSDPAVNATDEHASTLRATTESETRYAQTSTTSASVTDQSQ